MYCLVEHSWHRVILRSLIHSKQYLTTFVQYLVDEAGKLLFPHTAKFLFLQPIASTQALLPLLHALLTFLPQLQWTISLWDLGGGHIRSPVIPAVSQTASPTPKPLITKLIFLGGKGSFPTEPHPQLSSIPFPHNSFVSQFAFCFPASSEAFPLLTMDRHPHAYTRALSMP